MSRFCSTDNNFCPISNSAIIELCPPSGESVSYHTQITLNGLLDIPPQKPPMEKMLNTIHKISITKYTTVLVKKPPGKKVLVVGEFMAGLEYIAKVLDQKVHFAHWDLSFQALIKNDDGSLLPLDFDQSQYNVYVCLEHEKYTQINERTISYNIVLLIWLRRNNP